MATLAMATADLRDLTVFSSSGANTTLSTEQARTGTYSYKLASGSGINVLSFTASSTVYIKFAVYLASNTEILCAAREGTTNHDYIKIEDLDLTIWRLTSKVFAKIVPVSNWIVIEFKIVVHNIAGELTLKINGEQVYSATGLDTRNSGTGVVDNIIFYTSFGGVAYLDDIVVDDANWPGLGGLEVLRPSDDGHYTDWDAGGHADVADDSDATYVATDAEVAAKHSFALPTLAADRKTPTATGLFTKSQLSGAGAGTLRPFFRKSTTDTPGDSQALSTSLAWAHNFHAQLPDEVGLEVVV